MFAMNILWPYFVIFVNMLIMQIQLKFDYIFNKKSDSEKYFSENPITVAIYLPQ